MLRRFAKAPARAVAPQGALTRRTYTDYAHREYPRLWLAYFCILGGTFVSWAVLFGANSNWFECHRERHRAVFQRMHQRVSSQATGYTWSSDWGPEIKSAYRNLPSDAQ